MRYFFKTTLFAYFLALFWGASPQWQTSLRVPASYPNFASGLNSSGVEDPVVAPEPRKLGPPVDSTSLTSMKDIEDSYAGFLANDKEISKAMDISQLQLNNFLMLRSRSPVNTQFADPTTGINIAIRQERNRLEELRGLRQLNSQFAYRDISLKYLATQVGLRSESHQRVQDLLGYIMHVQFLAYSQNLSTTTTSMDSYRSGLSIPNLPVTNFPGTVDRSQQPSDPDYTLLSPISSSPDDASTSDDGTAIR